MKKYIIYAPHKCGSTITKEILTDIFNLPEGLEMGQEKTINNDAGENKLRFERILNLKKPANIDFIKDDIIFIPRNPAGITISMFYSFGYTHSCPMHKSKEQFELEQQKIQKIGLYEFFDDKIAEQSTKIEECWNWPITNKTILPYELMINNFGKFLKELLKTLDMTSAYDRTYKKFIDSFEPIEDRSNLIETGKIKTHKRTTDIYDWKKKLNEKEQINLLSRFPFIQQYDDFLNNLL